MVFFFLVMVKCYLIFCRGIDVCPAQKQCPQRLSAIGHRCGLVCMCVYECVHVRRGQRATLATTFLVLSMLFSGIRFLTGLELTKKARLADLGAPGDNPPASASPPLGLQVHVPLPSFSHVCCGLNSGPCAWAARTFLNELYPWPHHGLYFSCPTSP